MVPSDIDHAPDRRQEDARLGRIEQRLDDISEKLSSMKVQDEKILHIEGRINTLWGCWDRLVGQDGTISKMRDHQASCPRGQIKWLWIVVVPMGLTQLGMAMTLFQLAARLAHIAQAVTP